MSDEDFCTPGRTIPPRQPAPGEPLFSFRLGDQQQVSCELRSHGEFGWEAQFYIDGEFSRSHRFDTRMLAIAWAMAERKTMEAGL